MTMFSCRNLLCTHTNALTRNLSMSDNRKFVTRGRDILLYLLCIKAILKSEQLSEDCSPALRILADLGLTCCTRSPDYDDSANYRVHYYIGVLQNNKEN